MGNISYSWNISGNISDSCNIPLQYGNISLHVTVWDYWVLWIWNIWIYFSMDRVFSCLFTWHRPIKKCPINHLRVFITIIVIWSIWLWVYFLWIMDRVLFIDQEHTLRISWLAIGMEEGSNVIFPWYFAPYYNIIEGKFLREIFPTWEISL